MKIHMKLALVLSLLGLFFVNCQGAKDKNLAGRDDANVKYTTVSNFGDYADWTFDGTTLNGTWLKVSGSNEVKYTLNVVANCNQFTSATNHYTCTVDASSRCTLGSLPGVTCPANPSGTILVTELYGAAIAVQTTSIPGDNQLHIGFVSNTNCTGTQMTYNYIRNALGQNKIVGIARPDAGFVNYTTADFSFSSSSNAQTPSVQYATTLGSGSGVATVTDAGCNSGQRVRTFSGTGFRAMPASDTLVIDRWQDQFGMIAIRPGAAASIDDLSSRKFGGLLLNDQGIVEKLQFTTSPQLSGIVPVPAFSVDGAAGISLNLSPASLTNSISVNPSYPNFSVAPLNTVSGNFSYSLNSLSGTYATLSQFSGLYRLDGFTNPNHRMLVLGFKLNDRIGLIGVRYGFKLTTDTPPLGGGAYASNGIYTTGTFAAFEKIE